MYLKLLLLNKCLYISLFRRLGQPGRVDRNTTAAEIVSHIRSGRMLDRGRSSVIALIQRHGRGRELPGSGSGLDLAFCIGWIWSVRVCVITTSSRGTWTSGTMHSSTFGHCPQRHCQIAASSFITHHRVIITSSSPSSFDASPELPVRVVTFCDQWKSCWISYEVVSY